MNERRRRPAIPDYPEGELGEAVEPGAVGPDNVRLWIRNPAGSKVTARLEVEGRRPVIGAVAPTADTDWTGFIELRLPEPAPGLPYVCTALGRTFRGILAPAPGARTSLRFGFGSCHQPYASLPEGGIVVNKASEIYPPMLATLRREQARFLLLVGDQSYSDVPDALSIRREFHRDQGVAPSVAELLQAYRRHYRGAFQQSGFRALRESLPTYCVWDDHETFAEWGSHRKFKPFDEPAFEAACRAYCEYQRLRDPGGEIGAPPYHYSLTYGDIGFLVLDLRGERDWEAARLIGEDQWSSIESYLTSAAASGVQTLFVICSVPLAHVSRWAVLAGEWVPEFVAANLRDQWSAGPFIGARDRLLSTLMAWQAQAPARQVIVLGGDVHAAGAFTIADRASGIRIQQFTSSALSHPLHGVDLGLNLLAIHLPNLFEPHFEFHRRFVNYNNNFGFIRVDPLAGGGHHVTFEVYAWDKRHRTLRRAQRIMTEPGRSGCSSP